MDEPCPESLALFVTFVRQNTHVPADAPLMLRVFRAYATLDDDPCPYCAATWM
jgi:hypothetical protein